MFLPSRHYIYIYTCLHPYWQPSSIRVYFSILFVLFFLSFFVLLPLLKYTADLHEHYTGRPTHGRLRTHTATLAHAYIIFSQLKWWYNCVAGYRVSRDIHVWMDLFAGSLGRCICIRSRDLKNVVRPRSRHSVILPALYIDGGRRCCCCR